MSWLSKLTGVHINPIKNEYSLNFNEMRDSLERAAVLAGNYLLPGSSILTKQLASKGVQDFFNTGIGRIADIGSGGYGSMAGNLANYGKIASSVGSALGIGGGASGAAGAAGATGAGAAGTAGAGAAGAGAGAGGFGSFMSQYGTPIATLASSLYGANAAGSAAEQQAAAQREANALQLQMYLQSRQDLLPYSASGIPATNALLAGLGIGADKTAPGYGSLTKPFSMADYQADPGYAFRLSEGTKALERSAAARGGLLSGGALRETQRYGQGLASQEYQSAYDRYMGQNLQRYNMLAEQQRLGQSAAAGQAAQASNYGAAGAAGLTNIGAAQAAGTIGAANALSQGVQGLMNYYSNQNLLNTLRGSTYGQPATTTPAVPGQR